VKEHNERSPKLKVYLDHLDSWFEQKNTFLKSSLKSTNQKRRLQEEIDSVIKIRARFQDYVKSQFEVELKVPFARVVAAFLPNSGGWS
jgi:hypothetical protein